MKTRKRVPIEERLWARVLKRGPDDCWLWTGSQAGKGYGVIRKWDETKWAQSYAHREVLILASGLPDDTNNHALHSCDTPLCCNPSHLSWGSNSKNRKKARNRLHNQGNQKLVPEQVEAIRQDPRKYGDIALTYGLHISSIARIKQGRGWKP